MTLDDSSYISASGSLIRGALNRWQIIISFHVPIHDALQRPSQGDTLGLLNPALPVDRHSPTPDALGYIVCASVYRAVSLALALETDRALRTAVLSAQ